MPYNAWIAISHARTAAKATSKVAAKRILRRVAITAPTAQANVCAPVAAGHASLNLDAPRMSRNAKIHQIAITPAFSATAAVTDTRRSFLMDDLGGVSIVSLRIALATMQAINTSTSLRYHQLAALAFP